MYMYVWSYGSTCIVHTCMYVYTTPHSFLAPLLLTSILLEAMEVGGRHRLNVSIYYPLSNCAVCLNTSYF